MVLGGKGEERGVKKRQQQEKSFIFPFTATGSKDSLYFAAMCSFSESLHATQWAPLTIQQLNVLTGYETVLYTAYCSIATVR